MTAALDPALLTFRPLVAADFPALHVWFNAPHARRWFGKKGPTLESVVEEFGGYLAGSEPINSFIVRTKRSPSVCSSGCAWATSPTPCGATRSPIPTS
jgi:hypothetical protein